MLEFTAAVFAFFTILFGTLEFAQVYYEWNAATKATQYGARLAAVSDPGAANLVTLTGTEPPGTLPGVAMPAYDCVCKFTGGTLGCTGSVPTGATACGIGATGTAAMNAIFYGRTSAGLAYTAAQGCQAPAAGFQVQNLGMCNYLDGLFNAAGTKLTSQNLIVEYQYTGLGYAGRLGPTPTHTGGAVPTIIVSLTGVTYNFTLVGGLAGITSVTLPTFTTTVTGEDLAGGTG